MDTQPMRDRAEALLAAWNSRDYDAVRSPVHPDVVLVDHIRGRTSQGAGDYVARFRPILEAYPDMRGETISLLVDGSNIVHETVWRGRHTLPLETYRGTLPASNERVSVHLITRMEIDENGKLTQVHAYGTSAETPVLAHAVGSG